MRTIKPSKMIPVKRVDQKTKIHASESNSIMMCEVVDRKNRILRFPDEKVFIKVTRYLEKHMDMEFYQEQEKVY